MHPTHRPYQQNSVEIPVDDGFCSWHGGSLFDWMKYTQDETGYAADAPLQERLRKDKAIQWMPTEKVKQYDDWLESLGPLPADKPGR